MSYSCSDFTDDIIETLIDCAAIDVRDVPDDDPSRSADLAMAAIYRLAEKARRLDVLLARQATPAIPASAT